METENDYYTDKKLRRLWQTLLDFIKRKNTDRVYIVDGRERLGKSTFAIQQACKIEPELLEDPEKLISRICFTPDEFLKAVREVKNGIIIFDEAFRGLSSRGTMSKVNKIIIQALMEMGQNNNAVFIVLPSFFMLDVYPAMHRSDVLFHIYADKKGNRCFVCYNHGDKNKIYQMGIRKGYNYLFFSKFRGRFFNKFPGGDKFEKAYLKKKAQALNSMLGKPENVIDPELFVINALRDAKMSWNDIGKVLGKTVESLRGKRNRSLNSLQCNDSNKEKIAEDNQDNINLIK